MGLIGESVALYALWRAIRKRPLKGIVWRTRIRMGEAIIFDVKTRLRDLQEEINDALVFPRLLSLTPHLFINPKQVIYIHEGPMEIGKLHEPV